MNLPRLVLAGAHSGVGKTSLSMAIMSVFTRQGICVQPYKVGPDYIDPAFHQLITGRASRNLDSWLMPPETVQHIFYRSAPPPDTGLSVIEGVMGLFDGQGTNHIGSTAHVAEILQAPVVLVINGEGMSRSAAALVAGYAKFSPALHLAGVIINRVSSRKHYQLLREGIERYTRIPCLGYLLKNRNITLEERHLGLIPANEVAEVSTRIVTLADMAAETLDLAHILDLAQSAPSFTPPPAITIPPVLELSCTKDITAHQEKVRIGVTKDAAFCFYYQDNLDLLEELGAELVLFSPLHDTALPPDLHGLYLGGGFPEIFSEKLEANSILRSALKAALEEGLPAYAECGSMLYLMDSVSLCPEQTKRGHAAPASKTFSMTGFFPHRAEMTTRLQDFGYVTVTLQQDTVLGPTGTRYRAHEFHYSRLLPEAAAEASPEQSGLQPAVPRTAVFLAEKPDGRFWSGGLCKKNVLAGYPHLHFYSNTQIARNFVTSCLQYKRSQENRA